jgi:hypothetical protein
MTCPAENREKESGVESGGVAGKGCSQGGPGPGPGQATPMAVAMAMAVSIPMGIPPGVRSSSSRRGTHHRECDRVHPRLIRSESAWGKAAEGLPEARRRAHPSSSSGSRRHSQLPFDRSQPGLAWPGLASRMNAQIWLTGGLFQPVKSPKIRSHFAILAGNTLGTVRYGTERYGMRSISC